MKKLIFLFLMFLGTKYVVSQSCLNDSLNISTGFDPVTNRAIVPGGRDPRWIMTTINQHASSQSGTNLTTNPQNDRAFVCGLTFGGWVAAPNQSNYISFGAAGNYGDNPSFPGIDQSVTFTRTFRMCHDDTIRWNLLLSRDNYMQGFAIDGIRIQPDDAPGTSSANYNGLTTINGSRFLTRGTHIITISLFNRNVASPTSNAVGLLISGFLTSSLNTLVQESDCQCENFTCSIDTCNDQFWHLRGNVVTQRNFIGSINNADFKIRTNNIEAAKFTARANANENSRLLLNPSVRWNGTIGTSSFIGVNDSPSSQRLRISAGNRDVQSGAMGAAIDLHGNNTIANQGKLDLVAGSAAHSTNTAIRFWTNTTATNQSEKMVVLGNGNVGIGTTSPTDLLDVNGTARVRILPPSVNNESIVFANSAGQLRSLAPGLSNQFLRGDGTWGTINIPTGNFWNLNGNSNATNPPTVAIGTTLPTASNFIGTTTNHPFVFASNNLERMRIMTNGNVGIGTSNPTDALHVFNNIGFGGITADGNLANQSRFVLSSGGNQASVIYRPASTRDFAIWAQDAGQNAVFINTSTANIGIGNNNPQNRLHVEGGARVTSLPTANRTKLITANTTNDLGSIDFPVAGGAVNPTGVFLRGDGTWASAGGGMTSTCTTLGRIPRVNANGSSNLTCSQIFDNGTSVGINITSGFAYTSLAGARLGGTVPTSTGTVRMDVNGVLRSTMSIVTSDGTLKTNIKELKDALSIVSALNGRTYSWSVEAQKEKGIDNGTHIGFIAQEIQKVLPELVIEDDNKKLGVNYTEVIPVLVEAVKELNTKVENQNNAVIENEALKSEIAALKSDNELMKEKFALLEKTIAQLCESGCAGLEKKSEADALYQSIPNPTDGEALINYYLSQEYTDAKLTIVSTVGKVIKTIQLENKKGNGSVKVSLDELSEGTYLYTLTTGERVIDTKKLQILKLH